MPICSATMPGPASYEPRPAARRTLTAARLDRDADLDRDLGAVATALHHDAGVPAIRRLPGRERRSARARRCGIGGIVPLLT